VRKVCGGAFGFGTFRFWKFRFWKFGVG